MHGRSSNCLRMCIPRLCVTNMISHNQLRKINKYFCFSQGKVPSLRSPELYRSVPPGECTRGCIYNRHRACSLRCRITCTEEACASKEAVLNVIQCQRQQCALKEKDHSTTLGLTCLDLVNDGEARGSGTSSLVSLDALLPFASSSGVAGRLRTTFAGATCAVCKADL